MSQGKPRQKPSVLRGSVPGPRRSCSMGAASSASCAVGAERESRRRSSSRRGVSGWVIIGFGLLAGLAACAPLPMDTASPVPERTPLVLPECEPQQDLRVRRSRVTYRVHGSNLEELRESFEPQRYRDASGMAWDAYTWWEVRWSYPFIERIGTCALGREQVSVEIRIHLPRWEPPTDADPELVTSWDDYLAALEAHEEGHAQIALAAACEIRNVLRTLKAQSDCDRMELEADRATQEVIDRYREFEERFDFETNHGASDGAILP